MHVWGYWYFSRQSWFQLVLHPLQHFSWCTLHYVHLHKLTKQDDNIQPWRIPFPLKPVCCSMSSSYYCFLTCIQISQEAGQVVWHSHLLKNFPQFVVIHTVKGFCIVSKAERVFLELLLLWWCNDVGNSISGSSAFSKSWLNIWKFMVHVLLKHGLENFEHYFASVWGECNCAVVWTFFGIAFLWDWNENWPFPVLWPLLFSKFAGILSAALSQHHLSGFEIAQLEFHHLR